MVKIAVVGLGFMGKTHIGVYQKLSNVELSAICDSKAENLNPENSGSTGNIETSSGPIDLSRTEKYTDYDQMLMAGGFDCVDICLPTYLHEEAALKAMKAGYHVFLEKPMTLDTSSAARIIAKMRATGRILGVGQCLRFWPCYAAVKQILAENHYGRPLYVEFSRLSARPKWTWDNWVIDSKRSGEAALDLHIHDTDMVIYLFGRPHSLHSAGVLDKKGGIPHISTLYTFPDGLIINSTGGWICSDSFGFNMRAMYILEDATIELDFAKDPILTVFPMGRGKYSPDLPPEDGYYYELKDFCEALEKGRPSSIVTPESAAQSVELCLAEIRSVREKREIVLDKGDNEIN